MSTQHCSLVSGAASDSERDGIGRCCTLVGALGK